MNVVCFTFREAVSLEEVRAFLGRVRDDGHVFFTPTVYKNTPAIRAAISNWQTTDDDVELGFHVLQKIHARASSIAVEP